MCMYRGHCVGASKNGFARAVKPGVADADNKECSGRSPELSAALIWGWLAVDDYRTGAVN